MLSSARLLGWLAFANGILAAASSGALAEGGRCATLQCMGGYVGRSKSRGAVTAEREGKLTGSRLARLLGVRTSVLRRHVRPGEWHHTSSWYTRTTYYHEPALIAVAARSDAPPTGFSADEIERARTLLARMREESSVVERAVFVDQTVTWTEWGSSRQESRRRAASGCRVEISGEWAFVTLPDGSALKKRLGSRGLRWDPPAPDAERPADVASLVAAHWRTGEGLVARFRRPRGRAVALRIEVSPDDRFLVSVYREANGARAQLIMRSEREEGLPHLDAVLADWLLVEVNGTAVG